MGEVYNAFREEASHYQRCRRHLNLAIGIGVSTESIVLTLTGGGTILWPIFSRDAMRRTRQVIAVMVVATALCAAERSHAAVASSAAARPSTQGFARTLARKLTSSF